MKRKRDFYFKNEFDVMKSLGLKQTAGSGNGWIEKEDGQNDFIIAQLKSTDAASISIKKQDIDTLKYNAILSRKTPVFVIQFLSTGELFFLCSVNDVHDINEYLNTGVVKSSQQDNELLVDINTNKKQSVKKQVVSSSRNRENFYKQKQKEYEKRSKQK